eukprot:TRINITY_DN23546_c0_g3_i2.p1 TRINITY_DN23546_c0_g3~~TRINITY_DN23546_c0_g3_i2.p1  ORF type:complete len:581 (+),score=126.37 TRINITY_DN23546_c0_g3_i2:181-1923(+)
MTETTAGRRFSGAATMEALTRNIQQLSEALEIERAQVRTLQEELEHAQANAAFVGTSPGLAGAESKANGAQGLEELESLRAQVRDLTQQLAANNQDGDADGDAADACVYLQMQLDESQVKISKLERECEASRSSRVELEQENMKLREQIAELTKSIASSPEDHERALQQHISENAALQKEIDQLKAQFAINEDQLKRECAKLKEELDASSKNNPGEVDELQRECAQLRQEATDASRKSVVATDALRSEYDKLRIEREAESKRFTMRTDELQQECSTLRERLTATTKSHSEQVETLQLECNQLHKLARDYAVESDELKQKCAELEKVIEDSPGENASRLQELENERVNLKMELAASYKGHADEVEALQKELKLLKGRSDRQRPSVTSSASMNERIDELLRENRSLKEKLDREKAASKLQIVSTSDFNSNRIVELERECQMLRDRSKLSKLALGMEADESANLRSQMAALTKSHSEEVEDLQGQCDAYQKKIDAFTTEVKQLREILGGAAVEVPEADLLLYCESLQSELDACNEELDSAKINGQREADELQKEVDRLLQELKARRQETQGTFSWLFCATQRL